MKRTGQTARIADDEPLVRTATSEMLRKMGQRVIEAESGADPLAPLHSGAEIHLLVTRGG